MSDDLNRKIISWLTGSMSSDQAAEFEQQANEDSDLAARIMLASLCTETFTPGDREESIPPTIASAVQDAMNFMAEAGLPHDRRVRTAVDMAHRLLFSTPPTIGRSQVQFYLDAAAEVLQIVESSRSQSTTQATTISMGHGDTQVGVSPGSHDLDDLKDRSERQWAVLLLVEYSGRTLQECAGIMDLTTGQVEDLLKLARENLRQIIEMR
jgi:hypothetical protein